MNGNIGSFIDEETFIGFRLVSSCFYFCEGPFFYTLEIFQ